MHPERIPFVGGNWKMNGDLDAARRLAAALVAGLPPEVEEGACQVGVYPPFPHLGTVRHALGESPILLGGQDVSAEADGAFTGQVSAEMLIDCGCGSVIIGHSERRHGLAESDSLCGEKLAMALESSLWALLCVGETWEEREAGRTDEVTTRQLMGALEHVTPEHADRLLIAYEPVWAIGTGRSATPDDAQRAHSAIRGVVASRYDARLAAAVRILYGGSVNAGNAAALFAQPDVDGGLIGGASLKAADFLAIVAAAVQAHRNAQGRNARA